MDVEENDDVVRILTISSSNLVKKDAFNNSDIDVEFVCVPSVNDAMEQLDEWAGQGKAADIVDVEYYNPPFLPMRELTKEEIQKCEAFKKIYGTEDYTGVEVVSFFNDWNKKLSEDLQIGKLFLNELFSTGLSESDLSKQLGVPLSIHHVMEYHKIYMYDKYDAVEGVSDYTMREYLNEKFGANYPLDDDCDHNQDISTPEL